MDRRVFVSRRRSSCPLGRGGDTALVLDDGEVKKSVRGGWEGDDSRRLLDFRDVSSTEAGGRLLWELGSASVSVFNSIKTSSWSNSE